MYDLLDEMGVSHLRQHLIGGKFCVDAFVPAAATVVQMDGDYWHGNPRRYPNPDSRQRKRMSQDRSQDAYMAACGYTVVRIWESELRDDSEAVRRRLLPLTIPPGAVAPPQNNEDRAQCQ